MMPMPLTPPHSGRAKKDQSQSAKLFPGDCSTTRNPLTFLQHLKDAIRKHTTVDPESQVGEVFFKDKFLTQSAPDICRKRQRSVAEGEKSLDQLIQLAMSVYYNWELTNRREKGKRHHDLIAALREGLTQLRPVS
jgi:hypothetical protein